MVINGCGILQIQAKSYILKGREKCQDFRPEIPPAYKYEFGLESLGTRMLRTAELYRNPVKT